MCGVGGLFSLAEVSAAQEQVLCRMKDFMNERGPDANGLLIKNNLGLVHTRLSIIDIDKRSNQPMESENWILSFNGEIINFVSIRMQLKSQYQFQTNSDSEVLLLALEAWGLEKTLKKCAGMYAFLAYDKKNKLLYAVRDRLGIKPLYYFNEPERALWFASTPATIAAALPQKHWTQNSQAIASFFALGAPFTQESTTTDIYQVPPASYLTVAPDGRYSLQQYWQPEYQEQFHMDELIEIVQEYKTSDVKSALFMSGGIDSTFLGSILKDMDFFHLLSPELNYAKQVAKTYSRPLVVVKPNQNHYVEGIKNVCKRFGEPFMSCGIPYSVSYEVAQKGYKMAISANGADELFFGYPRTPLPGINLPSFEEHATLFYSEQLAHIFRDKRHFHLAEFQSQIPSLLEIGQTVLQACFLPNFPECASARWLEILTYVMNDLNPTLDAASMANSLEVRVPFLDHRIVQGVLSWPADKLCTIELGRKAPLKQHLSSFFNKRFLFRPKLGFSIDDRALSDIQALADTVFKEMQDSGFIQSKQTGRSKYFARDEMYMKNMLQVFKIWKGTHDFSN